MRAASVLSCLGVVLSCASAAFAASGPRLSVDRLTRSAGVIVEGRVTEVQSEWTTDQSQIFTTVTLEVSETYKGDVPGGELRFRYLGGTVGDITMSLVGQPSFDRGERVLVFLHPNYGVVDLPVIGFSQGKFRVAADASGVEILEGDGVTLRKDELLRTVRAIPQPKPEGQR
jgi:hypothetical protein